MLNKAFFLLALFFYCLVGCDDEPGRGALELVQVFVGPTEIKLEEPMSVNLPRDQAIVLLFSLPVDRATAPGAFTLKADGQLVNTDIVFSSQDKAVALFPSGILASNTVYTLELSSGLKGAKGEQFVQREVRFTTAAGALQIVSTDFEGGNGGGTERNTDVSLVLDMTIVFSDPVDVESLHDAARLEGANAPSLEFSLSNDNKTVTITTSTMLRHLSKYRFTLSSALKGAKGESFSEYSVTFYTAIDSTPKFPVISEEDLLTKVQQQTFKYFWDFAEPVSGMARERNTSSNLVTSGGSGFGIMALIVGIERGFITRQDGLERLDRILDFLENADRFHGAWSHWIDGTTGDVIPFSANDNGGDLVETSFLIQGLLTFRQYLDPGIPGENTLIERINALWESVEWDWYTRGEEVLYWHWSPDKAWIMNHKIRGYNECLITYVLAAASQTHTIDAPVYHTGWAQNGAIENGKTFYDLTLPLGFDYGGPLFFSHYSFLGLDPRDLVDDYANYWTQNVNHTMINRKYCIANPQHFVAYGESCWGLSASDNHQGYSAHSPTHDLGVITPTAALSSFPYTPDESMEALKFFYYTLGDRLWGEYGFYDAFNATEGWYADSWLAIDQGPIVVMIENHRTGLLWDLFMSCPEVQAGLTKLGFSWE